MAKVTRGRTRPRAEAAPPQSYEHKEEAIARPEIGAAPRFKAKAAPAKYRYDSSLAPALDWDTNPARETACFLLSCIEDAAVLPAPHRFREPRELKGADGAPLLRIGGLQDAVDALKRMQAPFLNWAGKAERQNFEVPALPLFVHERLSTAAIIKTLEDHRRRPDQAEMFDLFADPQMPLSRQVDAYQYKNDWVNRLILGDSLVVMNSLLRFEGLGGQVQMIYIDPPYGVKFGSNFQPFVRKRDVSHNDDMDMTREPEMVQAYRDTWQLGLHSYLTYLRDRLLVARDLLTPSGSVFVQISDENVHHVRQISDEIFQPSNFVSTIVIQKTSSEDSDDLSNTADYVLWYARDRAVLQSFTLYRTKKPGDAGAKQYIYAVGPGFRQTRRLTPEEIVNPSRLPEGWRVCRRGYPLTSQDLSTTRSGPFIFEGKPYSPGPNRHWSIDPKKGLPELVRQGRIYSTGKTINGIMLLDDMPGSPIGNVWTDTGTGSFTDEQVYVVQTSEKALERCILLATEPGQLVLDPTCGSGTTAYAAEKWGRRWITIDTSRVPLALARQRLLSATFQYYRLRNREHGPVGGFLYKSKLETENRSTDGCGVQFHHTLSSLAGEEKPTEIIFWDKPEIDYNITRITGPFVVEATLPTPQQLVEVPAEPAPQDEPSDHVARMIEVLRRSPTIALPGNHKVTLKSARRPGRSLSLSAEAQIDADDSGSELPLLVAILFGPADGPVTAKAVLDAAKEANVKGYHHLYVIGFAITADARENIDAGEDLLGLPATFVTAAMDLQMGDLLKNQRSSQIFSVCGAPDIEVIRLSETAEDGTPRWQVKLRGLDVFDPIDMRPYHCAGNDVPCWMLDTAYNGMVFHADQVFFPKTSAWDSLRKALKATHDEAVWAHLAGDLSAPFAAPAGADIAVKVIDERGNELPVVRRLAA